MFSSITVILNIMRIEFSHSFIVELNPLIIRFLDVTEIVTKLSTSIMQNHSFKCELKFMSVRNSSFLIMSIIIDVEFLREFQS